MSKPNQDYTFDAVVVGIGHAGIEAALSLARSGFKTLALSISLDNAGFLACNPSIGGTAKGHLVCEVDALGGEMGKAADRTLTHLRMLNSSKGPAVQSLRAQIDKYRYHDYMKSLLENEPNLYLRQCEVKALLTENGAAVGVETVSGLTYRAKAVVVAAGVYLNSTIIVGDKIEERGPSGFPRANYLADSLSGLGFRLRRFKTGTPARVKRGSVDLAQLEIQRGEDTPYTFSTLSEKGRVDGEWWMVNDKEDEDISTIPHSSLLIPNSPSIHHPPTSEVCYLGYTNADTHRIIRENLLKSPKYAGLIKGAGARYCPSVEDKIVRFADKERHPFFLEPEGAKTQEMYVQGLSTGLPAEIQLKLYRSIKGFERVEIMRDAYAIEYECIDPTELFPTLESKRYSGLFFAGQINGTSGYEEAAAQGIVAGINAAKLLKGEKGMVLPRESSYIGVLIDDLVTKGTDEPYRMMTSRAEYRLLLRQDNADLRLEEFAKAGGILGEERLKSAAEKRAQIEKGKNRLKKRLPQNKVSEYFEAIGEPPPQSGLSVCEVIRRNNVTFENFAATFDIFADISKAAAYDIFIGAKYEGYIRREQAAACEARRVGDLPIPSDTDFSRMGGLRTEAKEKLAAARPLSIGQASRIPGVTPADISVLVIKLKMKTEAS